MEPTIVCGMGSSTSRFIQNQLNLGFNYVATLDNPDRILEELGKQIRHIPIRTPADLVSLEIRKYVRQAISVAADDARKFGIATPPRPQRVVSTVKAIYPKKVGPDKAKSTEKPEEFPYFEDLRGFNGAHKEFIPISWFQEFPTV